MDGATDTESWGSCMAGIALATLFEPHVPDTRRPHLDRTRQTKHEMTDAAKQLQALTEEFQAIGKGV